jgi:hypothetical protein
VSINGLQWVVVNAAVPDNEKDAMAADHPDPPPGARVSVWFWRERDRSVGLLFFKRLDSEGRETCIDTYHFTGVFKRKSSA